MCEIVEIFVKYKFLNTNKLVNVNKTGMAATQQCPTKNLRLSETLNPAIKQNFKRKILFAQKYLHPIFPKSRKVIYGNDKENSR